jgi:transposase-like protein
MPQAASRDPIYRRRRYSAQLIEQRARWYLTYRLSYRDLAAMMAERKVTVSHTTIMRWVRHYVPEYERRWSRFSKPTHSSWRVDETSVSVGGPAELRERMRCPSTQLRVLAETVPATASPAMRVP